MVVLEGSLRPWRMSREGRARSAYPEDAGAGMGGSGVGVAE
jgi:hypothetical protein